MISGEVAAVLPDLQDWAATRTLARSQPANTQPTQPTDGASAKTALCDSPETPLGFSVMAITSPITVTPRGASTASTTFLLPYTEGQVEANTQPTQPKDGASAKTALCDSPETPLGFSVMAITSPIAVTPQSASRESSTFLLPLGVGQVETLLTTRAVLTTSTSRDLISLQQKLSACPIFSQNEKCGPWNPPHGTQSALNTNSSVRD